MKHLVSTITILFILLSSSMSWGNVTDYFQFKLGDDYKSVISRINFTDPYKCKGKENLPSYGFPVRVQTLPIFQDGVGYGVLVNIENQNLLRVTNWITNSDCGIESVESLHFCPSNGELVLYQVGYPINQEELYKFNPVLDEESEKFIGFTEGDELLDYKFQGRFVSFSVKNTSENIWRNSSLNLMSKTPSVFHEVTKVPENFVGYGTTKICPEGPDIISEFKPKYTSLNKVFRTGQILMSSFEQKRQYFNKCSVLFPENKRVYEDFWKKFREFNEEDFNKVRDKIDQLLISLNDEKITKEYKSRVEKEIEFMTSLVKNLSIENDNYKDYSLEWCTNILVKQTPEKIKSRNMNKNQFDPGFVKNLELK